MCAHSSMSGPLSPTLLSSTGPMGSMGVASGHSTATRTSSASSAIEHSLTYVESLEMSKSHCKSLVCELVEQVCVP